MYVVCVGSRLLQTCHKLPLHQPKRRWVSVNTCTNQVSWWGVVGKPPPGWLGLASLGAFQGRREVEQGSGREGSPKDDDAQGGWRSQHLAIRSDPNPHPEAV